MKALVFAAGLGTRLGEITRDIPKAMVKVGGVPMLERVLLRLREAGFSEVVVNACYKAECIEEFLDSEPVPGLDVRISREPGPEPFETGGGIRFARPLLHAPSPHPGLDPGSPSCQPVPARHPAPPTCYPAPSSCHPEPPACHPEPPSCHPAPPSCHPEPVEGSPSFLAHNADILTDLDLAWFSRQARPGALATLLVTDPKPTDNRFFLFTPGDLRLVGWTNTATGEVRGPVATPGSILSPSCHPDTLSCHPEALSCPPEPHTCHPEPVEGSIPLLENCIRMSFCGIHVISNAVFPLMESWPERFSITDFYIQEAARHPIYGVPAPAGTLILDIGSPSALAEADRLCR